MSDFILGHYAYWFTIILFSIGLYGILFKKNLIKKVIGLSIIQASVILFFVSVASKVGATVPVIFQWIRWPIISIPSHTP